MPTKTCECDTDGFCPRYNREMRGRFREICAGVNCDLGTAAAFRAQWARETGHLPSNHDSAPKGIVLITDQAPGDAVAMTAAIYSLHCAHPGKYTTSVHSPYPEVFQYNPYVSPQYRDMAPLHMHYPAINQSNERGIHFMQGWCEFLGTVLGVNVPLMTNRPHIYFDDPAPPIEDFWLVCSGGKKDFTNKLWGRDRYQEVIHRTRHKIDFVQVGNKLDDHPPLTGVRNMVGSTSLRELFGLTRRARGVLCGVSLLMHVAAALEKPAVVIAGGREPVQWNAYPKQHYLHTVGALPCSTPQGGVGGACWRSRVVPLGDGTQLDNDPCLRPEDGVPACMTMITPAEVATLILRYNNQINAELEIVES